MALLCADSSDMPTVQARVLWAIADIVCTAANRYGARAQRLDGVRAGTAEGTVIAIVTVFILVCPRQPVHPTSGRHGPTGAASTGPLVTADASFSVCLVLVLESG